MGILSQCSINPLAVLYPINPYYSLVKIGLCNRLLYPIKDFEAFKKGYANYCAFMVKSLKGKVKVWEVWNESFILKPTFGGSWNAKEEAEGGKGGWLRKFVELIEVAVPAIREVDPDAIIIAGGHGPVADHRMLDILKKKKAARLLDGIVSHLYPHKFPPEVHAYGGKIYHERDGITVADDDHSYFSIIRRLREKMKAAGMRTTDIYMTEFGYTTYHRTLGSPSKGDPVFEGFSEATQAKYLTRYFILQLVSGIKVAIQYDFQDDGMGSIKHQEGHWGLVRHPRKNYEPKPSFYAVQRLCTLLSDPVKQFKPDWKTTVSPDRYLPSKNWKYIEPYMIWDGQKIQSLNRVEKYLFRNAKTGEVMLVLWNAVRPSDRSDLLSDVTLDTAGYTGFTGIDIMTGKSFKVNASTKDGKTVVKDVVIPDYPVVIRMTPRK